MKITKILASEATPAKAILNRAQHVALTSAQRKNLPDAIELDGQSIEVSVADKRALSVGDVLLDESGHFYVIEAAPENILLIKGDEEFAAEAAVALLNRGIEVAQVEGGFAIAKDEQLQQLLTDAGLEFEEVQLPFDPIVTHTMIQLRTLTEQPSPLANTFAAIWQGIERLATTTARGNRKNTVLQPKERI